MLITGVLGAFAGEFRLDLKCSCVSAHLVRRTLGGDGVSKSVLLKPKLKRFVLPWLNFYRS